MGASTHPTKLRAGVGYTERKTKMKSCVTISLVEEARGGPFVLWDGVAAGCKTAADLGYDAVEIFPPEPEAVDEATIKPLLDEHGLKLAAVGTGAGMVKHGLTLTNPDAAHREKAVAFVRSIIDVAGKLGASAIIGSMQGKWSTDNPKEKALSYLGESLKTLGEAAKAYGVPLIYEPLNRYETNLCNTMKDGAALLESSQAENVVLLADLFHMNIEETTIADGIRDGGKHIGHVHFVDSNRRPAGLGHMDYAPIAAALKDINYDGYASAEAFPYPDPLAAATQTIESYKKFLA